MASTKLRTPLDIIWNLRWKIEKLKVKIEEIDLEHRKGNPAIIHLKNAIEVTLNALGDIFKKHHESRVASV